MKDNTLELPGMPAPVPAREGTGAWAKYQLKLFHELSVSEGGLMPPTVAADITGLSRARIAQLLDAGQLRRVEVAGRPYVSVREVEGLLTRHRPSGVHVGKKAA